MAARQVGAQWSLREAQNWKRPAPAAWLLLGTWVGTGGGLGAGPLHMEPWLATLTHRFSVFLREDLQWSPFLLTPYLLLTISSHLHIRTCGLTVSSLFMDIEYRELLLGKDMKCNLSVERLSPASRPGPCTVIRVGSQSEVWATTLLDCAEQLCCAVVL